MSLLGIYIFVLGLIIGSFLNVVILRLKTKPITRGRSRCFSCNQVLSWADLIPFFSFIILKGRCRHCRSRISIQYPLVELLTGTIFLLIFNIFGLSFESVFYALISSILIVIAVYDMHHKIIPDSLVFLFVGLTFIWRIFSTYSYGGSFTSLDFWAGFIFFAFFASLWLFSRGRWMGFGDAKLVVGIGFLLGFKLGLSALLIAFWSGAIVGILMLLLERSIFTMKSMNHEIPFAPFLIFGTFLSLLTSFDLASVFFLL